MSAAGRSYAELMAPAWETGLADISDIIALDALPHVKWAMCQSRVQDELKRVDWESTDLPVAPPQDETQIGERMPLTPREQAERFLAFNFDDTLKIATLAVSAAADKKIASKGNVVVETLKRGKRDLLLPSRLADVHKSNLFYAIKFSDLSSISSSMFNGPVFEGKPIILNDQDGQSCFEWNAEIRRWVLSLLDAERGCPANGILTTTQPKMPLTYFFWDRLVEAMYA